MQFLTELFKKIQDGPFFGPPCICMCMTTD